MKTKKQIIEELKKYGVEATLRPRKATLEALLKSKKKANKFVNLYEEALNACKIESAMDKTNFIVFACCFILLSFLVAAALGVFN